MMLLKKHWRARIQKGRVLHTHSPQVVQELVFTDAHQMRQRGIPKIRACAIFDVFMKAKGIEQVRERLEAFILPLILSSIDPVMKVIEWRRSLDR